MLHPILNISVIIYPMLKVSNMVQDFAHPLSAVSRLESALRLRSRLHLMMIMMPHVPQWGGGYEALLERAGMVGWRGETQIGTFILGEAI